MLSTTLSAWNTAGVLLAYHHIAIAGVCYQYKLSPWVRLEDLIEQKSSNGQRGAHITEIQRSGVETATRIGLIDEVHEKWTQMRGLLNLSKLITRRRYRPAAILSKVDSRLDPKFLP